MDIVAITGEGWVFLDADLDIKVAILSAVDASFAFAFDTDLLAVVDAGWDVDVKVFVNAVISAATARFAWVFDDFASAMAVIAWAFGLHGAKEGSLGMEGVSAATAIRTG